MRRHDPAFAMNLNDPDVAPVATDWLALDEPERIERITAKSGTDSSVPRDVKADGAIDR